MRFHALIATLLLYIMGSDLLESCMSEYEKNTWEPASSKLKLKSRDIDKEELFVPAPPPKKPVKEKKAKPAKSSGNVKIRFMRANCKTPKSR